METINQKNEVVCKYCGSTHTRKYGLIEGNQKYFCNDCRRKFSSDNRLFKMKTPYNQVSSAVDMYYKGMSIADIKDNLNQQYGNCPSTKTIYAWVDKYTQEAKEAFKDYHPQTGDTFIADETMLKIAGKNVWMYTIIDADTRFLLATRITTARTTQDAKALMEKAAKVAGKAPKQVMTDKNNSYLDGIELAFGSNTEHIQTKPFTSDEDNTELIERWHSTLKERTKTMRGLKSIDSAHDFIDGFLVYYNYLRPHESLNGKTPAEEAKVNYPFKSWAEITRNTKPKLEVLVTPATVSVLSQQKPIFRPITHRNYDVSKKRAQRKEHVRLVKMHRVKHGMGYTRRSDI